MVSSIGLIGTALDFKYEIEYGMFEFQEAATSPNEADEKELNKIEGRIIAIYLRQAGLASSAVVSTAGLLLLWRERIMAKKCFVY